VWHFKVHGISLDDETSVSLGRGASVGGSSPGAPGAVAWEKERL